MGTWHNFHEFAKDEIAVGSKDDVLSRQLLWHATPENPEYAEDARKHPLIPLYMHRMMPSVPCESGLPVFSMHQCSGNIVYGKNLWDYLEQDRHIESGIIPEEWFQECIPYDEVPFWGEWYIS